MRTRLRALTLAEKTKASQRIRNTLSKLKLTSCAIFAGSPNEPNLIPLLKEHPEIIWFLPKVVSEEKMVFISVNYRSKLKPGAFGILEPSGAAVAPTEIETIICPGLAFTQEGHRIGQGGGFYDRFLAQFPHTKTIGVSFSCQLTERIPTEPHDALMEQVISL